MSRLKRLRTNWECVASPFTERFGNGSQNDKPTSISQEHGVRRLAIFGSVLGNDFGQESDIDLIVEFEPNRIPGLLGVAGMEMELSELFGRRKVALRTAEDLSPYFRQDVLDRVEVQYAKG